MPGNKRKDLVDRFRDDPKCKLFLSTDAGGVGLNLQFASIVVNMDLPWNPAVLEQRIGRVHRLGQKRPVQVVNFVAKGTIEEGMLEVLKFKKSLFAGVLDGGAKDVFMGGSRLTKFMETVEKASASIPEASAADDDVEDESAATSKQHSAQPPAPAADPWSGLIQSGVALLQNLQAATQNGHAAGPSSFVHRDAKTGESYMRLPVPKPEAMQQALQALATLAQAFTR